MMDCGWYALNAVRTLMDRQVPEIISADAQKWSYDEEIDEGMKAELRFADGVTGSILCSYAGDNSDGFVAPTAAGSARPPKDAGGNFTMPKHPMGGMRWDAEVTGSQGVMSCANYGVPHAGNFIIVEDTDGKEVLKESVDSGGYSTYDLMVLAFCSHVRQVEAGWVTQVDAFENTGAEPIKQMEVVDAIYRKSGLLPRTGPAGIAA
jgi:predicted dehydrogenase